MMTTIVSQCILAQSHEVDVHCERVSHLKDILPNLITVTFIFP